ncbi:MAG: hypothetical protein JWQ02_847 [Capsulimonas sp.]|nr:hypothetical protein [Capsulimonas sp.]
MPTDQTILVIDDEKIVQDLVSDALTRGGFNVLVASDAQSGLELALSRQPQLILLDIRLPRTNGLDVLRQMRSGSGALSPPVILLTGESSEADRIVGLEMGADDYVTKPFSPRELVARVRSVLRRFSRAENTSTAMLQRGKLSLDLARHQITYDDRAIAFTATEFRIVETLARHAGNTLGRLAIHEAVHGSPGHAEDRSIDAHIKTIRRKLGEADLIETIRGFGYKLR